MFLSKHLLRSSPQGAYTLKGGQGQKGRDEVLPLGMKAARRGKNAARAGEGRSSEKGLQGGPQK